MLIISRKADEGLWIDGDVFVKVLSIGKTRVRLSITAPSTKKVLREELAPIGVTPLVQQHERPIPAARAQEGRRDRQAIE